MADDPGSSNTTATLLDLLFNPLIADNITSCLDLASVFRLARTARPYRDFVLTTPSIFRKVDLSRCKGAYTPMMSRVDVGGHSWRAERMDENLTEDEFYAGPLRFVLSRLGRMNVLNQIQVLVLDEMASVSNDVVHELLTSDRYAIRLLSIRKCPNVNQAKLQQLLRYICRPTRPEGTPLLQGVYVFTDPAADREVRANIKGDSSGVTNNDGATLGSAPSSQTVTSSNSWYAPSGRMTQLGSSNRTSWEETIQACKGIIAFDAVLCASMHNEIAGCLLGASRDLLMEKPSIEPIAAIALGSDGCAGCGKAPSGCPVWGESDLYEFPLQPPAPSSGRLVDALRPTSTSHLGYPKKQRLIVACSWCLADRHCERCHKWWCGDCYDPKKTNLLREMAERNEAGLTYFPGAGEMQMTDMDGKMSSVKVFSGLCVEQCLVPEMMAGAGSNGMWA